MEEGNPFPRRFRIAHQQPAADWLTAQLPIESNDNKFAYLHNRDIGILVTISRCCSTDGAIHLGAAFPSINCEHDNLQISLLAEDVVVLEVTVDVTAAVFRSTAQVSVKVLTGQRQDLAANLMCPQQALDVGQQVYNKHSVQAAKGLVKSSGRRVSKPERRSLAEGSGGKLHLTSLGTVSKVICPGVFEGRTICKW